MNSIQIKKLCFYFHGGGLIFGNPYDLPSHISSFFAENDYTVIPILYPLAPKATFEEMIKESLQQIESAIITHNPQTFIYFGRSAGAFLMFHVASKLPADKLISFYGYMMLGKPFMNLKSNYYDSLPNVADGSFIELVSKQDRYIALSDPFYLLYIYLRQNRMWSQTVKLDNPSITINLQTPIFLWHSLFDPDVPYAESKLIADKYTNATLSTSLEKTHELDLECIKQIEESLRNFLNHN